MKFRKMKKLLTALSVTTALLVSAAITASA